ncbi:hypothetical protein Mapa_000858 [Marchantia paleacea]|nr:hypothetical protein Mapa_000858 [Marchantia paleacea]
MTPAPPLIAVAVQKTMKAFQATVKVPVPTVSAVSPTGGITICKLSLVLLKSIFVPAGCEILCMLCCSTVYAFEPTRKEAGGSFTALRAAITSSAD